MRLITMGDIHGNIEAFKSVLDNVFQNYGNQIDAFLFLGDYCCDFLEGEECVQMIHELGKKYPIHVISGNRETGMVKKYREMRQNENITWCLDSTMGAPLLSCRRMSENVLSYLSELDEEQYIYMDGMAPLYLVHKMPLNAEKIEELKQRGIKDILVAHTHEFQNQMYGGFHLMNPGSVGLIDEGRKGADYGVLTWKNGHWVFEGKHVDYDYEKMKDLVASNKELMENCKGWGEALLSSIETGINCCALYMFIKDILAEKNAIKSVKQISFGEGRNGNLSPQGGKLKDQIFIGQKENVLDIKNVYYQTVEQMQKYPVEEWMYEEALKLMKEYVYSLKEKEKLRGRVLSQRRI